MKKYLVLIILSLIFFFTSCKEEAIHKDYKLKGPVFGTIYSIIYLNGTKNYQKSIDSLFLKMNLSLSTYISTSDISRINKGDTTVVVDDFFEEVFRKSKMIFKETDGFFDPTVGNLVNAWGFGPEKGEMNLTKAQIKEQMQYVGFNKVQLKNNNVFKENSKIYLDFNSIAKGYGIDVIARFLESRKIFNYLVEIGGEIRTSGFKKNNEPWVVKLVDPIQSNSGFKNINLSNKAIATSGNYMKYRVAENGEKYVHTINPKTGYALESNLLSVSVIANLDCANVDAYATAFMAMGLEKTKLFLAKKPNLKVVLLFINNADSLEEYTNYTYN